MKAVAYQTCLPIEHPDSLQDIELDDPIATGRDLLVEVRAVSVNPVDSKVRHREAPTSGQWRILGWDGVGTVRAVGAEVTPGVTTDELDRMAHELTIEAGGYPSPLNYRGFPKSLCTSVNEVVCAGVIPCRPDQYLISSGSGCRLRKPLILP